MKPIYCGRFAPTPSGALHLGSLLAALASWLDARCNSGRWQLRIDDLDAPRCPPGTDRVIMSQLRAHGLDWDGEVYYQSVALPNYERALERLASAKRLYRCSCTRRLLAEHGKPGPDGPVYCGRCRQAAPGPERRVSLRLQVPEQELCFDDASQGRVCRQLGEQVGDFVVRRNDGQIAYQLACAMDESAMQITHVVRGADLLGSTFQQLAVMQALGLEAPNYRHLPVLIGIDGHKLSKQAQAEPLQNADAVKNLRLCLVWLGQEPPAELPDPGVPGLLRWARQHWQPGRIPNTGQIQVQ